MGGGTYSHTPTHGARPSRRDWLGGPARLGLVAFVGLAGAAAVLGLLLLWPTGEGREAARANADEIGLTYERLASTVMEVSDRACSYSSLDNPQNCRNITVRVDEGPDGGSQVALPEFNLSHDRTSISISPGDKVIVGFEESNDYYFFVDRDRRTPLVWLAGLFAVVVVALGRRRGALALAGMAITLAMLVAFVAPSVLDGNDPVLVAVIAATLIAFVSLYLTHGFDMHTTVALAGTLASLGLTLGLSAIFYALADFTGLATEEGLTLPLIAGDIDLAALLLGGAIIGALGALDDVTVTQVATVAELRYRSHGLRASELFASGIRVGREHIAATVNTLLLAYVGAGMPLLLLFAVSDQSLAMVANSELIAVEIVRTLCGSMGLVAAVPVTTMLAVWVTPRPDQTSTSDRPGDAAQAASEDTAEDGLEARDADEARWEDFAPDERDRHRW